MISKLSALGKASAPKLLSRPLSGLVTRLHLCKPRFSVATSKNKSTASAAAAAAAAAATTATSDTSAVAKWTEDAAQYAKDLDTLGELAAHGLGGYTPVGILQTAVDALHTSVGLPWWASIVCATLVARTLLFPLIIKSQKNAALLNNIRPEMEKITKAMKEYQAAGNTVAGAMESQKLQALFKLHNCNPVKALLLPFAQMPIFISFFLGLRRMANAPLESMQDGGMFWFTDLTSADPYFVLPILASGTMLLTMELGAEAGVNNQQYERMKVIFRMMSVIFLPITIKFPTAIFIYWITSNCFSMMQTLLLRVPAARKAFGIPKMIKHAPDPDQQGFLESMKTSYNNAQQAALMRQREEMKKRQLQDAARAPIPKLYKYKPKTPKAEKTDHSKR